MTEPDRPSDKYVIGPDGSPLTIADLPKRGTRRWVPRRKAEVVAAVRGGLLSLEEACSRYSLTAEEFLFWQESIDKYGLRGLRTTRMQRHRPGYYRRAFVGTKGLRPPPNGTTRAEHVEAAAEASARLNPKAHYNIQWPSWMPPTPGT